MTLTKRLLATSTTSDLATQLKRELSYIAQCFQTEDVGEAMRAFQEKRPPNFKGK
jgi:enoyl-CoA hydratase/carnithine racemase